ncbi:hypothetical protein SU69_04460 [Thermosipho melanesiensis]|uniref:Integral membrane protein-like protein n=2 Tax=Thermosipho melanesiensis TaxID=46541 RepID=A6LLD3_THEM4|nr:lysylphosphatidylglycerol synthase transmembrane domain-containing protein [Thermosipho melanesiensis]ABR30734.1 conserved hypothetical protein 374 [Thermosipho melanesiensis BI429]APT73860.1 hypothetical protein BW47_04690 [Thermosipho melanesiensis]OOC35801.1 hypothetical protein SU68_04515 [Thermosipho melanesiensis]OOC38303.1 hypothetical protein SU69_04460 [Thermosipho melanesiensis]OOC38764.1 hypothetical protein SU70_04460 [Thermosipho melanesiensis]
MKKFLRNAVIAVSISLAIIVIMQFFQGDLSNFFKIPKYVFITTFLGYVLMYFIGGLYTKIFLKFLGYEVRFLSAFENYFFGNFFSYITPLYIGGQPFQVYHLSKLGVKSEDATNMVMTRLFETFFVTLVLDIWIFSYAFKNLDFSNLGKGLIIVGFVSQVGLVILILTFMFFPKLFKIAMVPVFKLFKFDLNKLENWLSNLKKSVNNVWKKDFYIILIDTAFWFLMVCLHVVPYYLIFRHFSHFNISFFRLVGVLSLLNSIAYYAPTPGAAGGIEGVYQISLSGIIRPSVISSAIFLWRLFSYYIPICFGLLFIWRVKDWQ